MGFIYYIIAGLLCVALGVIWHETHPGDRLFTNKRVEGPIEDEHIDWKLLMVFLWPLFIVACVAFGIGYGLYRITVSIEGLVKEAIKHIRQRKDTD